MDILIEMKSYILTLILCFIFCNLAVSQRASGSELIYIDFQPDYTEIGQLEKSRTILDEYAMLLKNPLQQLTTKDPKLSIHTDVLRRFETATLSGKKILFYAHSWLGESDPYFSKSIKLMLQQLLPEDDWLVVILLRPTSLKGYNQIYQSSYDEGYLAYSILEPILEFIKPNKSNNYFLAHSLGSRFVEGLLDAHQECKVIFNQLVFTVPDTDLDFIDRLASARISEEITLYLHAEDRMLHIAALLQDKARLGNQSICSISTYYSNILFVDTSNSCFTKERLDLSNHVYFNTARGVCEDIKYILSGNQLQSQRILIHQGKYKLDAFNAK
jgi:hypothetical protein